MEGDEVCFCLRSFLAAFFVAFFEDLGSLAGLGGIKGNGSVEICKRKAAEGRGSKARRW